MQSTTARALALVLTGTALVGPATARVTDGYRSAPAPRRIELARPEMRLPLEVANRHLFLLARVDGRGPYRFLLDTGTSIAFVIDDDVAETLELDELRPIPLDGHFGRVEAATTRVETIHLGGVDLHDCVGVIHDLSFVASGPRPVHGVLGLAAFADVLMGIDFRQRRLVLSEGALPFADGETVLDLVPVGTSGLGIEIEIAGTAYAALLDTGAGTSHVAARLEERVPFAGTPVPVHGTRVLTGVELIRAARLDGSLVLGSHRIERPVLGILGRFNVLGNDVLRHFHVTIDQREGRIRLTRNDAGPIAMPSLIAAGFGAEFTDGRRVVGYVIDGSPAAAAGLRVDDVILRVDGRRADGIGAEPWYRLFSRPSTRTLLVQTPGEEPRTVDVEVVVVLD